MSVRGSTVAVPDALALALADGRSLEHRTGGDPDGFPFVYHSGTPSAAIVDPLVWDAA
ncbi:MAG: alpha/beta hydrolase [Nocardioides sp.]|nr:alpha/beta hydrolase [Nocardioides sp.]